MQANNLPTSVLAEGEGSGGVGMATFYTHTPPPLQPSWGTKKVVVTRQHNNRHNTPTQTQ